VLLCLYGVSAGSARKQHTQAEAAQIKADADRRAADVLSHADDTRRALYSQPEQTLPNRRVRDEPAIVPLLLRQVVRSREDVTKLRASEARHREQRRCLHTSFRREASGRARAFANLEWL
jgi:hypothetical protein